MKNILVSSLFAFILVVSACHYGQDEANKTIERNESYKNENKDYSINRAGDRAKKSDEASVAPVVADSTTAKP